MEAASFVRRNIRTEVKQIKDDGDRADASNRYDRRKLPRVGLWVLNQTAVQAACPKCDLALSLGVFHGRWNVCYCDNCGGFLIESGALHVIAHELRTNDLGQDDVPVAIDSHELTCQRSCPACLGLFDTHPYDGPGNVVIDSCRGCELTWLDHGELATIMRAPGKRPSPDSSPVVPTYTHFPTDAVAESIAEASKFVIKNALRFIVMH